MKITIYIVLIAALAACAPPDKKAELEKLKESRDELDKQIASLESEMENADTSAAAAREIAVMQLKPAEFSTYIDVQGHVDAAESVNLSTEIPGTITKINVKAGDRVKAGQILAETDTRAVQQQMAALQTSLSLVNQLYEKQKNLWDQKIGTEMQFLTIKAQKEATESALAGMLETLRMTKIISPIAGTVDQVFIKLGQAVSPGIPAIRVVNFSDLKVVADVAESYSARVKNGSDVIVVFPDMNDSVKAKVTYASRAIDPLTRTFRVETNLDNKKEYHPNMVAKLKLNDYRSRDALVLPVKFIQKGGDGRYVYLGENNQVVRRVVVVGREYGGLAEVTGGLKEGDLIITEGYDLVDEGDRIKIKD